VDIIRVNKVPESVLINSMIVMVFKHTSSVWIPHESKDDHNKACPSRVTRLFYPWKGDFENPTEYYFCLDCGAFGKKATIDTTDSHILKVWKRHGFYPQIVYANQTNI
jgi:hypothetical protein